MKTFLKTLHEGVEERNKWKEGGKEEEERERKRKESWFVERWNGHMKAGV